MILKDTLEESLTGVFRDLISNHVKGRPIQRVAIIENGDIHISAYAYETDGLVVHLYIEREFDFPDQITIKNVAMGDIILDTTIYTYLRSDVEVSDDIYSEYKEIEMVFEDCICTVMKI